MLQPAQRRIPLGDVYRQFKRSGTYGTFTDDSILYTDAVSHIAYAGGRLFVVSNIGAIASLDAYTGTIAWLNIYRTDNQAVRRLIST